MSADPKVLDKVTLLLVSGLSDNAATDACVDKLGVDPQDAVDAVAEARQRITIAADYHRDEQLGTAILRLQDLYVRAIKVQDVKTALAAQKELNKLLRLYAGATADGTGPDAAEATADLLAIRAHLSGLDLGSPETPTVELVRLAAALVLQARALDEDRR
jgi:hypothetical protein